MNDPYGHQYRIAQKTMSMSKVGAQVMGGMTHPQAINVLKQHKWSEDRIARFMLRRGHSESEVLAFFQVARRSHIESLFDKSRSNPGNSSSTRRRNPLTNKGFYTFNGWVKVGTKIHNAKYFGYESKTMLYEICDIEGYGFQYSINGRPAKLDRVYNAIISHFGMTRKNPLAESVQCGQCGGEANYMGTLGSIDYYRCRNCGADVQGIRSRTKKRRRGK